jgi:hypothetical protein
MPCLQKRLLVFFHKSGNPPKFRASKPAVVVKPDGPEPELGLVVVAADMNVRRLDPVTRMEKEPVRASP